MPSQFDNMSVGENPAPLALSAAQNNFINVVRLGGDLPGGGVLGRTPFHFLCKSYAKICDNTSNDTSMSCDRNAIERRMTRILWILYRKGKAPSAIIIEDMHGVDVVEYALEADMSMTVIHLLQDMVARVHESNAKKKANHKLMQTRSQLQQKDSFCMACD
eukprot:scaffold3455_cov79-Skeletonema_dohrnii-CCMP3373.AAC.2